MIEGPDGLREALLAEPERFVQTFIERLMTYAIGRPLQYYDMPRVREVLRASREDGYRFSSIVMGIVESDGFQSRQFAPQEAAATVASND